MKSVDRILGEGGNSKNRQDPTNAESAFLWAIDHRERFPEAEPYIAKEPWLAFKYANDVLGGRWPAAETRIVQDPTTAYYYARYILKKRWLEAEPLIAAGSAWSVEYARDLIKGRWPEAEETIAKSERKDEYLELFPEAREDWAMNGWIDWLDT